MIFVNFKTYKEGSGSSAISLARIISEVADNTGVKIVSCPQAVDMRKVVEVGGSGLPAGRQVWAQHVDSSKRGKTTGWLPPEIAKEVGAEGTLLNHSEHKISEKVLSETVKQCKSVGLRVIAIANSLEEAKGLIGLKADFIGYEPPEFVGSKTTSVAMAKPEVIKKVVDVVSPIPVLVGAGVHSQSDVEVSLKLGAVGIILATDVVLSDDPKKSLFKLAAGFTKQ